MRWIGRRQSGNIEDRRGSGGGFGGGLGRIPIGLPTGGRMGGGTGGGIGIVGLLIILGVMWFAGVNPIDVLTGGGGSAGPFVTDERTGQSGTPGDEQGRFVAAVLAETEDAWTQTFSANGRRYEPPTLVLFSGSTSSACGYSSSASGPFYCPNDRKVYIDLAFFDQLRSQFRSPGDFAQAYVIAHEIGHHVQNLMGVLRPGNLGSGATSQAVRTELQADCFAGIWAKYAESQGVLEVGDIDEALNAASQIGDDTLLRRAGGRAVPDSFTHGSSDQRSRWFKRGYETGSVPACDAFSATNL